MTNSVCFSFIIPIFNDVNKLKVTVDSIAAIVSEAQMEVIIVDDDGPASNEEQVRALLSNHKLRSHYLRKPNEGPFYARKYGFKQSQGDYIVFVDCGDAIFPDVFSKKVANKLLDCEIDILVSDIFSQKKGEGYRQNALPERRNSDLLAMSPGAFFNRCNKGLLGTPGKIYRRQTVAAAFADIQLPPRVCNAEDLLLFTISLTHAQRVHHVNSYFYLYEVHDKSLSHDQRPSAVQRRFSDKDCVAKAALLALSRLPDRGKERLAPQLRSFFRKYRAGVRLHWVVNFPADFSLSQKLKVIAYYFTTGVFLSTIWAKITKKQFDYE